LALGFLATTARDEDVSLSVPPALARPIADAADHLRGTRATLREDGKLTGSPDAVRELLAVAIDESGERVSRAATALLRGEETPAALRAALAEAGALLALYETV
jgi:HPt (histidine-containing phosphotransfer) domain-containing protein